MKRAPAVWLLALSMTGTPLSTQPFSSMAEALSQPQSTGFWLERVSGRYRTGDPQSCFDASRDAGSITFDIGNNKALANLAPNGTLKTLTIYRATSARRCSRRP
jgi:hypothetical protein